MLHFPVTQDRELHVIKEMNCLPMSYFILYDDQNKDQYTEYQYTQTLYPSCTNIKI